MSQETSQHRAAGTASGFDAAQITPEDLAALQALFVPLRLVGFGEVEPSLIRLDPTDAGPQQAVTCAIELRMNSSRSLKLRIEPLPQRATLRHINFSPARPKLKRTLAPVLRVPVRRRRQGVGELSPQQGEAILRAIFKKYGEEAHQLHLEGVYAEVPAELAGNVRFTADRSAALLTVPPGFNVARASAGCYLVELTTSDGATRRTIFRL